LNYQRLFSESIDLTFKQAMKMLAGYPRTAAALLKVSAHEVKAKKRRQQWQEQGVSVPPLLIVSTTDACNLECKECYSSNICRNPATELKPERIDGILDEASAAGCAAILLAGGEPLLSPDWLMAAARHQELLGLVFTNGTLFNEKWYRFFAKYRHLIVLFSIEGTPERTDRRRGAGVSEAIKKAMLEMQSRKIPFGVSVTTGSHNYSEVTADELINPYIRLGCRLVIHVEYVPMGMNTEFMPLSPDQKLRLADYCEDKTNEGEAVYIAFPGNEEQFGGCLAAGRGFLHISAQGSLEPCPFAPYSDRGLSDIPFIEALRSPLLSAIRSESHTLREDVGGCSLRGRTDLLELVPSDYNT
jgi:MoaA/NifB/PqqE/SkfB family radical SAM enzyme